MNNALPLHVVHYGGRDPETVRGGVETFARTLRLLFQKVSFMTPRTIDVELVEREQLPVICDNHMVLDWPEHIPVVGFQHGVAAEKFAMTRAPGHWLMSRAQRRAAHRTNILWVACAQWIALAFDRRHGNGAHHIILHPVDLDRFDGACMGEGQRLILHDARTPAKGSKAIARLTAAFPDWRFEPLDCAPNAVPDRLRQARCFAHISRYEGNSIVCLEAMAMDLPCFFTRVGLMRDNERPADVWLSDAELADASDGTLEREFGAFLASLDNRQYNPRRWIIEHASLQTARRNWAAVMRELTNMREAEQTARPRS